MLPQALFPTFSVLNYGENNNDDNWFEIKRYYFLYLLVLYVAEI